MVSFLHIINPVKVSNGSDLFHAQPITFESMARAKKYAEYNDHDIQVCQVACHFEEDREVIPDYFENYLLSNSVKEIDRFKNEKKLPFIKDILSCAQEYSSDYVVYSNVDISLYPNFYSSVKALIEEGNDAICINRNTIVDYDDLNLEAIYGVRGVPHEGIDCFVIKRELLSEFVLKESIIGTGPVGLIFAMNMLIFSKKMKWITEGNFTFHLGDDKAWLNRKVTKDSLLYFSFEQLKVIVESLMEKVSTRSEKVILRSCLIHSEYFLDCLRFSPAAIHRKLLYRYCKGEIGDVTEGNLEEFELLIQAKSSKFKKKKLNKLLTKLFE